MTQTETTTALVARMNQVLEHDFEVRTFGAHTLIDATSQIWWAPTEDLTEAIVSDFELGDSEAYRRLCDQLPGCHDEDVDAGSLAAARDWYCTDHDEDDDGAKVWDPIARGW